MPSAGRPILRVPSLLFPMSQASEEAYLYSECFVVKEKQWVKKPERGSWQ